MTKGSLRALLEGTIDYAGMFPPASLTLHEAIAEYRSQRTEPAAWLMGRFVCPADQLRDLLAAVPDRGLRISLVVPVAYTVEAFRNDIAPTVLAARRESASRGSLPQIAAIDAMEFRFQVNVVRDQVIARPENLLAMAAALTTVANSEARMYFELSRIDSPAHGPARQWLLHETLQRLSANNSKAAAGKVPRAAAGFKLRCGGATAADVPSSAEVAQVIQSCRGAGLFWKATAGLHHPLRHQDAALGILMHGFVNLFTAAVMADVHRLPVDRIQEILDDEEASDFRFGEKALVWRDLSATCAQITQARQRGLRSFGSCSFDEPIHDLKALGWLP